MFTSERPHYSLALFSSFIYTCTFSKKIEFASKGPGVRAGNKNSSGQMRQRYAYDANESTRRLVEGGMSTGLTNTPTARGFSVLYHVFITLKQCILCSALRHKSYLTLLCVTSIRDFFCLGTFTQGSIWLPPRTLASSRGCSLVINMLTVSSDVSMQGRHWQPLTVHL